MPTLHTGHPHLDAAYDKAVRDVTASVDDKAFVAGESWPSVWVRDASYAIDLGAGLDHPDVARATMLGVAAQGAWAQDRCAHFGGWPRLTDAVVGAVGAWATYLATGDEDFLRWSFGVTRASLDRAEQQVFDGHLFRGCASFMESNSGYPPRFAFNGRAVGATKALSTNVLHHRAYTLAARSAVLVGADPEPFTVKADALKSAINDRFWLGDHYAYYLDADDRPSDRWEGLGTALAVLWGVADDDMAAAIFRTTQPTPHGLPCLSPPYPLWKPWLLKDEYHYHNGTVWPFVQGYWGWAAATRGERDVFAHELDALAGLAAQAATYHEFYRAGRPDGSARQLWSAAGCLALVHYGLFGISLNHDEIRFRPVLPRGLEEVRLVGFSVRDLTLDVTVTRGDTNQCTVDGVVQDAVPLTGRHTVHLTLSEPPPAPGRHPAT